MRTSALAREASIILTIVAVIAAVYVGVAGWADRQPRQAVAAKTAPPLMLPAITSAANDGRIVRLSDYGGRSVVVHFWASWCTACIDERPFVDVLWKRNVRRPFTVLTVAVNDDAASVRNTGRAEPGLPTVLLDAQGKVAQDWGVSDLPQTFLVDPDGTIAMRIDGPLTAETVAAIESTASAHRFIDRTTPGPAPNASAAGTAPPSH
jgi:cytochrome c biogenesis protein CcmG/thiol:disulfide interchange protein DsbE